MSTLASRETRLGHFGSRPRIVGPIARKLDEQQRRWFHEIQTPDVELTARLTESLNDVCRLLELEDDWDVEDAHRIDASAVGLASRLVYAVTHAVEREGLGWE